MNMLELAPKLGTIWNGMVVHVVSAGTRVVDPTGKRPDIVVDDENVACLHHALYCTAKTEVKIVAKIEAMNKAGRRT